MIERGHQAQLLDVARESIRTRIAGRGDAEPEIGSCPAPLGEPGAAFVTVTVERRLQGCIGSMVARRALLADVWHNARGAAFADPRFAPLGEADLPLAGLEIAVLGPLERMHVTGEAQLLAALRPGVDGLLIRAGSEHATFLPKVWDSLPEPRDFLRHLKRKMGRPDDFWDASLVAERYQTEVFSGPMIP